MTKKKKKSFHYYVFCLFLIKCPLLQKNHKDFTILAFRSVGAGKEKPFLESAVQLHKVM